jgi:hypothetical protein
MTTRKLLESAAKAAGMTHLSYCEVWDCMAVYNPAGYFEWYTYWNPVKNSDHAVDLISRLNLTVMGHTGGITVSNSSGTILIEMEYSSSCEASKARTIRLAITTVAAAIGESM